MSSFIFSFAVNADQELDNEDFSFKSMSVEESSDSSSSYRRSELSKQNLNFSFHFSDCIFLQLGNNMQR